MKKPQLKTISNDSGLFVIFLPVQVPIVFRKSLDLKYGFDSEEFSALRTVYETVAEDESEEC